MAHRKKEVTVAGHEVTVQQSTPDTPVRAWIDGYAAHESPALDALDGSEPVVINDNEWVDVCNLLAWMVSKDLYFCKNCKQFYNADNSVGTGFAGHHCGECDREEKACSESPDGEHHDRCLNPRAKRNAKIPTDYECEFCGRRRSTVPTG